MLNPSTPLFDLFFHKIIKEATFLDLPETMPYGFWIFPSGNFEIVGQFQHEKIATKIVLGNEHLKKQADEYIPEYRSENYYKDDVEISGDLLKDMCYNFLKYKKHFLRCVKMSSGMFYDVIGGVITDKQKNTIHDLEEFYRTTFIRVGGNKND